MAVAYNILIHSFLQAAWQLGIVFQEDFFFHAYLVKLPLSRRDTLAALRVLSLILRGHNRGGFKA